MKPGLLIREHFGTRVAQHLRGLGWAEKRGTADGSDVALL